MRKRRSGAGDGDGLQGNATAGWPRRLGWVGGSRLNGFQRKGWRCYLRTQAGQVCPAAAALRLHGFRAAGCPCWLVERLQVCLRAPPHAACTARELPTAMRSTPMHLCPLMCCCRGWAEEAAEEGPHVGTGGSFPAGSTGLEQPASVYLTAQASWVGIALQPVAALACRTCSFAPPPSFSLPHPSLIPLRLASSAVPNLPCASVLLPLCVWALHFNTAFRSASPHPVSGARSLLAFFLGLLSAQPLPIAQCMGSERPADAPAGCPTLPGRQPTATHPSHLCAGRAAAGGI